MLHCRSPETKRVGRVYLSSTLTLKYSDWGCRNSHLSYCIHNFNSICLICYTHCLKTSTSKKTAKVQIPRLGYPMKTPWFCSAAQTRSPTRLAPRCSYTICHGVNILIMHWLPIHLSCHDGCPYVSLRWYAPRSSLASSNSFLLLLLRGAVIIAALKGLLP